MRGGAVRILCRFLGHVPWVVGTVGVGEHLFCKRCGRDL